MKKLIAIALAGAMAVLALCGCGTAAATKANESDLAYVQNNGKLIVGITEYEPMDYYDANGELIGFDADFARAVCKELGIEADFQIIDWDMKETELKAKNIDVIWNGLTVTEDRRENMDFSDTYLTNKQCVIINKNAADKFGTAEGLEKAIISAESGSAGETAIQEHTNLSKAQYVAADSQAAALLALLAGNCDAIVVDYTLGKASVGNGDYKDMMILDNIKLADELYAIGFRQGSDLTAKVNEIIQKFVADGTLAGLAQKYDLVDLYEAAVK